MSPGAFNAQLDEIEDILEEFDLLRAREITRRRAQDPASLYRNMSYGQTWWHVYRNRYFDFITTDYALLIFDYNNGDTPSYSYLDAPLVIQTFSDYMAIEYPDLPQEEWDILREDYEEQIINAPAREAVTPMRYDYNPQQYTAGRHPASHIHLGYANEIRIGTDTILEPLCFVCFVLRQRYPEVWQSLVGHSSFADYRARVRRGSEPVPNEFITALDSHELLLR